MEEGRHHPHPSFFWYNTSTNIYKPPITYIVIDIDLPCKCSLVKFEEIYQREYKAAITHGFIRSKLELSNDVWLKLNGTFKRMVDFQDDAASLHRSQFAVQTALWRDPETNKYRYVSIFPNFIRRYTRPTLGVLEYISCNIRKGEDIFQHIDDRDNLLICEDPLARILEKLNSMVYKSEVASLLNARYTSVYNTPLSLRQEEVNGMRFPHLVAVILMGRIYFNKKLGALSAVYSVFRF